MRTRTRLLALAAGLLLALAGAADAATPFTAGTGNGHDLAVGADGTGHLVWLTDETNDRVGYCRLPAGGSACDSESTFLSFPGATTASGSGDHAQVFTPAANKVVILASCTQCPGVGNRTYRFISTNNGVDFGTGVQIGTLRLNGQSAYIGANDVALSVSGRLFQGQSSSAFTMERQAGSTASSVYDAAVARVPSAGDKAVYAVNNLDAVEYKRFDGPSDPPSIVDLNQDANWFPTQFLSAAEGNNDETHLSSGPSGLYLTYRYGQPTETASGCASSTRARARSAHPPTSRVPTRSRTAASRSRSTRRTPSAAFMWSGERSTTATGCATRTRTRAARTSPPRPTSPRARPS